MIKLYAISAVAGLAGVLLSYNIGVANGRTQGRESEKLDWLEAEAKYQAEVDAEIDELNEQIKIRTEEIAKLKQSREEQSRLQDVEISRLRAQLNRKTTDAIRKIDLDQDDADSDVALPSGKLRDIYLSEVSAYNRRRSSED